jgi:hypothetical protein
MRRDRGAKDGKRGQGKRKKEKKVKKRGVQYTLIRVV